MRGLNYQDNGFVNGYQCLIQPSFFPPQQFIENNGFSYFPNYASEPNLCYIQGSPMYPNQGFLTLDQFDQILKYIPDIKGNELKKLSIGANGLVKKEKIKKTTITETINMKDCVDELEKCVGMRLKLNYFCKKFDIKRRVMFDFLSVMDTLNICTRFSNEEFTWNGVRLDKTFISNLKKSVKADNRDIRNVFQCSDKLGLSAVCYNLIALFLYLNVNVLDLRKVAKLLAPHGPSYRTMLRKLYTISSSLEKVNFISRNGKPAEIILSDIFFKSPLDTTQISSLLNNTSNDEETYIKRREEYEKATS